MTHIFKSSKPSLNLLDRTGSPAAASGFKSKTFMAESKRNFEILQDIKKLKLVILLLKIRPVK